MQKRISSQATRIPRGIVWSTVTTERVAAGISEVGIVDAKLCVVEKVEGLDAKFKVAAFGYFEVLQRCHIKVQATGIVHEIATCVPKGKPLGSHKCRGIAYGRTNAQRIIGPYRLGCVRVADDIRVRSGGRAIGHSSVVKNRDAIGTRTINDAERRARLKSRNAR